MENNNLQLGEKFMIGTGHYDYIVDKDIDGNYCLMYYNTIAEEWYLSSITANELEQSEITKTTHKLGDTYYAPNLANNSVNSLTYDDDYIDYQYNSMGLLCRTKEEALDKLKKIQDYCKKEFT